MSTADTNACLVQMRNIHKAFGGVHAVEDASINLYPGEVVALLGHNGAGKSTLMKMLAGAYPIDSGEVLINGSKATIRTPLDAQQLGEGPRGAGAGVDICACVNKRSADYRCITKYSDDFAEKT